VITLAKTTPEREWQFRRKRAATDPADPQRVRPARGAAVRGEDWRAEGEVVTGTYRSDERRPTQQIEAQMIQPGRRNYHKDM
jgi:hypothetical protein